MSELSQNITVSVKFASGAAARKTSTFNVVLTNYVYASDILLENITFERDENGTWQSNTIKMFTNSQLNLGYSLVPNNSNMQPALSAVSEGISVSDGIIYSGNNAADNLVVKIIVKTSKNIFLEKFINIEVVAPHTKVEILITNVSGLPVTNVFVGEGDTYLLHVRTNGSDGSVLLPYFNGIGYKEFYYLQATATENVFRIIFTRADTADEKIVFRAQNDSFKEKNVFFSNSISINVFETTKEFNLAATSGSKALLNENGSYVLKAINKEHAQQARLEGMPFEAKLTPITSGVNTLSGNYEVFVGFAGDFVKVINNFENELIKMTITQEGIFVESNDSGSFVLRLKSNDFESNYTDFDFVIESVLISEFKYLGAKITSFKLFSNTNDDGAKSLQISNFSHFPTYAHLSSYVFESSGNSVIISGGKITATRAGTVEITINANGFWQTFLVTVVAQVDRAVVAIDDAICENSETLLYTATQLDVQLRFIISAFSAGDKLNDFSLTYVFVNGAGQEVETSQVLSKLETDCENAICVNVLGYGVQTIKYYVSNGLGIIEGLINVVIESEFAGIVGLKFESDEATLRVNLFNTAQVVNNLIISTDNENKPVDMTKIIFVSTNSEIGIDNTGNIFHCFWTGEPFSGEVVSQIKAYTINSDYFEAVYTLIFYYKEPDKFIENIAFECDNFSINAFESSGFLNSFHVTYTDNPYTCFDTVEFSASENNYVSVNKITGQITVLNTVHENMQPQIITIYATVQSTSGLSVYSYDFTIYWQKTIANIINIEFLEDNFEINANNDFQKIVEFLIFYDNSFACFDTIKVVNNLPEFVNCEIVENSVLLTFNNANQLIKAANVVVSLIVNNETEFAFNFNLFYESNFHEINQLEVEWLNKIINAQSANTVVFENALIINGGQEGNYNFSEINVFSNNINFAASFENGAVVVTSLVKGNAIITVSINDIVINFEVEITNFNEITTQSDLEALSGKTGDYIIKTSLLIGANFSPIENFSGYLTAVEGVVINTSSILFYVNNGTVENLNVVAAFNKVFEGVYYINGESYFDDYAGFVLINNGLIKNVSLKLTVNTQVKNVGGFVYKNHGEIINTSIEINFTNDGGNSFLGAFAYYNSGEIFNSSVLLGSVLTHYSLAAGFVYENAGEISYSNTAVSFYGIGNSRQVGFVARSLEDSIYHNCLADINYFNVQANRTYGFEYYGNGEIWHCSMFVNNYTATLPNFSNNVVSTTILEYGFK